MPNVHVSPLPNVPTARCLNTVTKPSLRPWRDTPPCAWVRGRGGVAEQSLSTHTPAIARTGRYVSTNTLAVPFTYHRMALGHEKSADVETQTCTKSPASIAGARSIARTSPGSDAGTVVTMLVPVEL